MMSGRKKPTGPSSAGCVETTAAKDVQKEKEKKKKEKTSNNKQEQEIKKKRKKKKKKKGKQEKKEKKPSTKSTLEGPPLSASAPPAGKSVTIPVPLAQMKKQHRVSAFNDVYFAEVIKELKEIK